MKKTYSIQIDEYETYLENGWKTIDVRDPYEIRMLKKLPNVINIPFPKVIDDFQKLFPDKNVKLIIICNHGMRSGRTAKFYQDNGYKNVFVLDEGIEGYYYYKR